MRPPRGPRSQTAPRFAHNNSTVKLYEKGTTTALAAVVIYDATPRKPCWTRTLNLQSGASYEATVTAEAKGLVGNPLDQTLTTTGNQPKTWSLTVRN
ncbi:MAG: hypothetical protein ACRDTR_18290 [Rubrobacter sp.]